MKVQSLKGSNPDETRIATDPPKALNHVTLWPEALLGLSLEQADMSDAMERLGEASWKIDYVPFKLGGLGILFLRSPYLS